MPLFLFLFHFYFILMFSAIPWENFLVGLYLVNKAASDSDSYYVILTCVNYLMINPLSYMTADALESISRLQC